MSHLNTAYALGFKAAEVAYHNQMPGGLGDNKTPKDFPPAKLERGADQEMEHTNDRNLGREMAIDHLTRDPEYYTKLLRSGIRSM
jgi:hypothetical protein